MVKICFIRSTKNWKSLHDLNRDSNQINILKKNLNSIQYTRTLNKCLKALFLQDIWGLLDQYYFYIKIIFYVLLNNARFHCTKYVLFIVWFRSNKYIMFITFWKRTWFRHAIYMNSWKRTRLRHVSFWVFKTWHRFCVFDTYWRALYKCWRLVCNGHRHDTHFEVYMLHKCGQ